MHQQRIQVLRGYVQAERQLLAEAQQAFQVSPCADENDTALLHEHINMMTLLMHRSQERLVNLESTITALENQISTLCQDCGEEIAPQRLLARPDTLRCTRCQEEWEEEQDELAKATMPPPKNGTPKPSKEFLR
ncbi:TraR/DksA family transcriptional regulator [Desulfovibrio cuneatus]|uniref:TraR/DksA family transcriptional regulator n=1 Tax=Desulfovibrio cuneatus TaxID=159728 RepID=UPI0005564C98|nr:TraR/DksA C4-type zinc finger protein [Desulfovibrio cuneatus]